MVDGLIGKCVVMAMEANPFDGAVLTSQAAAKYEKVFEPPRRFEAAMRYQAMPAEGNTQTACHPV